MPNIDLSVEEAKILGQILETDGKEVDVQISRADAIDFKQMLTQRREVIERVLSKLSSPSVTG